MCKKLLYLLVFVTFFGVSGAAAATWSVSKIADTNDGACDADCSLREAIEVAASGDTIAFGNVFNSPQTITLAEELGTLQILSKNLTIAGTGANRLTIRRAPESLSRFRVLYIEFSTITISGVTISGGYVERPTCCLADGGGGAFTVGGVNTFVGCHFTGNTAADLGGAIYQFGGVVRVENSTFSNNLVVSPFGFSEGAGAIYTQNHGSLKVINSTVSGNVMNPGFRGAGGIGIAQGTQAEITDSTVTDNQNTGSGAGGVFTRDGTITVRNSIIAGNRDNANVPDVGLACCVGTTVNGIIVSSGYNLIGNPGDVGAFNQTGDQTGNAATPLDARLAPLSQVGNATPIHRFAALSPAIDKGKSFGYATDQRGAARPFDRAGIAPAPGGDNSDIGAYEEDAASLTLVVTKTADTLDGACNADCSLREAIAAAAPGDTIEFAAPLFDAPQTITLSEASGFRELLINKNVTINGKGAKLLTVRRAPSAVANFRVLTVADNLSSVNLSGMTIIGGRLADGDGAGILNGNSVVNINACFVVDNVALNGIGGGIYNGNGGMMTITDSAIAENSSTLSIGGGGGIHNLGSLNLTNSTVSGNVKNGGDRNGGGIYSRNGALVISSSTVTDNDTIGGASSVGIFKQTGTAVIRNSIIAGNRNNFELPDVLGAIESGGYNLIGNPGSVTTFIEPGDQTGEPDFAPLDPELDPLADNGGATPTHRLQPTSPAIEKGKSFAVSTDQRGETRPFDRPNLPPADGGDNSDIGAYEETIIQPNSAPQVTATPNPVTTNENQPKTIPLLANDVDADAMTMTITSQPVHGTLTDLNPTPNCGIDANSSSCQKNVVYTPNANFTGTDSFSFKASDGQLDSEILAVDITVIDVPNTLTVTKTADTDDGSCDVADCSLREAIAAAQPGDVIEFASPFFDSPQTITLVNELKIQKNLTINGKGASLLTVRRVASPAVHRIFYILSAAVTLRGMTITGGSVPGSGGGGVLSQQGNTTIEKCYVKNNTATMGGGVENLGGTLTVLESTISGNTSLSQAQGAGGIENQGTLNLVNSTVSGNYKSAGGNQAGGVYSNGTATITNSTITDNEVGNTVGAGGVFSLSGTITIKNSIIAGNRNNANVPDTTVNPGGTVPGKIVSNGYNLIGNPGAITAFNQTGDLKGSAAAPLNPRLAVLSDYGGGVPTHAVMTGSPAVNNADPNTLLAFDQRGIARTIGGRADIGAFEHNYTFANDPTVGRSGALPSGALGQNYSVQFSAARLDNPAGLRQNNAIFKASENLAPYNFSVVAGNLPPGISLTASGALSGVPTSAGVFNFTLKTNDAADGAGGAQSYAITVLGPTASTVFISGRVATPDGAAVRDALVTLTDTRGNQLTARVTSFGFYTFDGLSAGETYVLDVVSKRYHFEPQLITLLDDAENHDLIVLPVGADLAGGDFDGKRE